MDSMYCVLMLLVAGTVGERTSTLQQLMEESRRLGEGGRVFAERVLQAEGRRGEGRVGGGGVETLQMKMREHGRGEVRDSGVVVPAAAPPGFHIPLPHQEEDEVIPLLGEEFYQACTIYSLP